MHHSRICLALLAVAACAAAEGGPPPHAGPPGGPPGQRPMGPPPEELFQAADADKDGKVTLAELTALLEKRRQENGGARRQEERSRIFDLIDTNKDGTISKEEFLAFEPAQARPGPGEGKGEGKGEGQGPRPEPPGPEQLFKRFDLNGDGVITLDEVKAVKEKNKERREGGDDDKPPAGQH